MILALPAVIIRASKGLTLLYRVRKSHQQKEDSYEIFSLDLSRPISLEVYADDCEDLEKDIAQFKI